MKTTSVLCLAVILSAAPLFAQESGSAAPASAAPDAGSLVPESAPAPAPSSGSAFGLTPDKPNSILPSGAGELPLIPDSIPPLDKTPRKPGKDDTGKPTPDKVDKTQAADDAQQKRIQMRIAKTKARRNPVVQELWDRSFLAKTEYEKRDILKVYYSKLCDGILKADPALKDDVTLLRASYISRLKQERMIPTEKPDDYTPIFKEAPLAPGATPTPTPAPNGKKKHKKKA